MRPIRSIIVFNSAAAGDFLTSLCWSQLQLPESLYQQKESGRMLIDNSYFKIISEKIFYKTSTISDLNFDQIFPVENTHYWNEFYKDMADTCYYIDYPDHLQPQIMDIYLEKVFDNDLQKMLDHNISRQNQYIASRAHTQNIKQILNIQWLKNMKSWRQNLNLNQIELEDFFNKSKLQAIVERLIHAPILDADLFDHVYNNWRQRNHKLESLFL